MSFIIDIMTLSCYIDRSPGEGGGIGGHAEGKEISTFSKGAISISQYYLKVKSGAQAHWLLAEMGLQDHPQTVRTELGPVDYRLEQISSSGMTPTRYRHPRQSGGPGQQPVPLGPGFPPSRAQAGMTV
jgi:hypothetical protein